MPFIDFFLKVPLIPYLFEAEIRLKKNDNLFIIYRHSCLLWLIWKLKSWRPICDAEGLVRSPPCWRSHWPKFHWSFYFAARFKKKLQFFSKSTALFVYHGGFETFHHSAPFMTLRVMRGRRHVGRFHLSALLMTDNPLLPTLRPTERHFYKREVQSFSRFNCFRQTGPWNTHHLQVLKARVRTHICSNQSSDNSFSRIFRGLLNLNLFASTRVRRMVARCNRRLWRRIYNITSSSSLASYL